MQTKKTLCTLLCLVLLAGMLTGCGAKAPPVSDSSAPTANPTDAPKPADADDAHEAIIAALDLDENAKAELLRAYELGFPLDKAAQETVSGAELAPLLDAFVAYAAPEKLAEWEALYPVLRAGNEPLIRFDAMACLFLAAYHVGGSYDRADLTVISSIETMPPPWEQGYAIRYELYGDMASNPHFVIEGNDFGYLDASSYFYCLSCETYPFEYDKATNSLRPGDNCTYAEALRAILRLIENYDPALGTAPTPEQLVQNTIHGILQDSEFYFAEDTAAAAPYYTLAEQRKESILNSPTAIVKSDTFIRGETYTGTAYYVSNNGDDSHDGLTPETAWKTPDRATWGDVKPGDAVFFERGSVFRLQNPITLDQYFIRLIDDVTYSAYGEGEKPVFTLSMENSARQECWQLYREGENGEKIWKYYKLLGDVGGITFDNSSGVKRVWEVPSPKGWIAADVVRFDPVNGIYNPDNGTGSLSWWKNTGEYRTVEENLTEDMTYISRVDITGITYPCDFASEYREGELYLRCDAGNPGLLCESIEIAAMGSGIYGPVRHIFDAWDADGYVLDNLTVRNYLDNAVSGFLTTSRDAVIQNCTVEWGGNRLHIINSADDWPASIGDGIYGVANNVILRNNYFLQGNNGITFESSMEAAENMGTYLAEGNLFEECWQAIRLSLENEDEAFKFEKIILRDNIILHSGENFDFDNPEPVGAINLWIPWTAKETEVTENILIGSSYALIEVPDVSYPDTSVSIRSNVFIQSKDGILMREAVGPGIWYMMEDAK